MMCSFFFYNQYFPHQVLILPIKNSVYEGGYSTNPLECLPSFTTTTTEADGSTTTTVVKMESAQLSINGTNLEQDPSTNHEQFVMAAYKMFSKNLGQLMHANSCSLQLNMFKQGYFFLLWDLTASQRAADKTVRHPAREGNLRLEILFDKPLVEAVELFIFSAYNSAADIDKNRNVKFQFIQ